MIPIVPGSLVASFSDNGTSLWEDDPYLGRLVGILPFNGHGLAVAVVQRGAERPGGASVLVLVGSALGWAREKMLWVAGADGDKET